MNKCGKFLSRAAKPAALILTAAVLLFAAAPILTLATPITNSKNSVVVTPFDDLGANSAEVAQALASSFLGDPASLVAGSASIIYANKNQIATLTGGTDLFGIEDGFVLSTGNANTIFGSTGGGDCNGSYEDPDLQKLITSQGRSYGGDTAVLEFQVVSTGTSLDFNYVFGSTEFDQGSQYNDIFGLFIKINDGDFENIALLPEGEIVTITNLRTDPVTNPSGAPISGNMNLRYITTDYSKVKSSFNGYSMVLTASKNVSVGDVITVKFVIADVGDRSFDSAIIMKKGSLTFSAKGNNITSPEDGAELELNTPATNGAADFSVKVDGVTLASDLYTVENANTTKPVVKFAQNVPLNCRSTIEIIVAGVSNPITILNNLPHQWSTQYAHDADDHWQTCTVGGCTGTSDKTPHAYTYAVNAENPAQLIESCVCGHKETATLKVPAESITYDGQEKKVATVVYSEGWLGGELAITYANNINVGTATASITKDTATASATFTISSNLYTVVYKADGVVVDTIMVEPGKDATAPAIPPKVGYDETAPVWDHDGKNITADTVINAVYTGNEYVITFVDRYGVFTTVKARHGDKLELPAVPVKDGYEITWETTVDVVTQSMTINAVYTVVEIPPLTGDHISWLFAMLLCISASAMIMLSACQKAKNINDT